ncbi:MAG: hypothetical protein LBB57_01225 [Clostridiales Family XIII bacterium]|nr:hypothetical protein [Clostridiales Family XIII bacterium]
MYYKERKPRKFNYDAGPQRGVSKKAIHMIILLLFLIAVFLFFFPNPAETDAPPDADSDIAEFSSAGIAASRIADGIWLGAR